MKKYMENIMMDYEEICGKYEEEYEENMKEYKENMKKYVVLGITRAKHLASLGSSGHIYLFPYIKALTLE